MGGIQANIMLTVMMCTHNGSDTISRTLNAFRDLLPPMGGWKLVIVDNASTDSTPAIIHQYSAELPVCHVKEATLGKAHALNTGLAYAEGDLVVFTDDDIIPDSDWLCEWRRAADTYPDIAVFGGVIVPTFEAPPPTWLERTDWMAMLYARTTPGLADGVHGPSDVTIFGPNWAVRPAVLAAGYQFDTRLMKGAAGVMGDETDFITRVATDGFILGFASSARVQHIVAKSQVTWSWVMRRFFRHGRAQFALEDFPSSSAMPHIAGVPRYLWRRLFERILVLPLVGIRHRKEHIASQLRLIAYDLGAAYQARLIWLGSV